MRLQLKSLEEALRSGLKRHPFFIVSLSEFLKNEKNLYREQNEKRYREKPVKTPKKKTLPNE